MDKRKIIVCQFYTDNVLYGKFSENINRHYCNYNGYTYISETNTDKIKTKCEGRSYTWYKPLFIKEIFSKYNPEYVLFLDADAILVNKSIPIEDFIDDKYEIVFAEDIGGSGSHSAMNAGAFIIKNTPYSSLFLDKWWSFGDTLRGKDARSLIISEENKDKIGYFREGLWHDQTCLTYFYEHDKELQKKLKIISNCSFNHYDYNINGFLFHAFRYGNEKYRTLDIRYKELMNDDFIYPEIKLIVYHIFAVNDFKNIVENQINRLKSSKLYDWCDKLEITFTGSDTDYKEISPLFENMEKVSIFFTPKNHYEYYAIKTIWDYSQRYNGKVFYFHTKGVSNKFKDIKNKEISERKIKGIQWWKEILENFLIDKWEESQNKLDNYDQCGVTNNGGWWWGNFWWSNLSWIRCNSEPYMGDRWYFEAWINHYRKPKIHEHYHFTFNPYYSLLPYDIYDTEKYKKMDVSFIRAEYGTLGIQTDEAQPITGKKMCDVTEKIRFNFESNNKRGFHIYIDNNIGFDPNPGFKKYLEIEIEINNQSYILVGEEGQILKFII